MFSAKFGFYGGKALPGVPQEVTATAGNGAVLVAWYPPAFTGGAPISQYTVEYSSDGGSTWLDAGHSNWMRRAWVASLSNGTAYRFRVAAVNAIGTGGFTSSVVSATPSAAFTPSAVLLTFNTSYTIPAGAKIMKAWVVGPGGRPTNAFGNLAGGAGGLVFSMAPVTGGSSLGYNCAAPFGTGLTMPDFETLKAYFGNGSTGGGYETYSGLGISGANGTTGTDGNGIYYAGGAVAGNNTIASCGRRTMTDFFGLFAALTLAGQNTTEDCSPTAALGSGAYDAFSSSAYAPGLGGGGIYPKASENIIDTPAGLGAVVLSFA